MRDLDPGELGFVYGAGGYCKPPKKHKAKKKGSGSHGSKSKGSRGKGSGSKGSRSC